MKKGNQLQKKKKEKWTEKKKNLRNRMKVTQEIQNVKMHRCDTNCMAYCLQFTSKALRPIVDSLETCYLMLTHSKLAIPYFNMFETCYTVPYVVTFETCYTLCQQIRNMLPYVDIFRTCFTSCWPVNIEGLSSLQLTILVDFTTNYTCWLTIQTSIQHQSSYM